MKNTIALLISFTLVTPTFAADIFGQPEKLCHALESEGLQTQGWKPSNSTPGEFVCLTQYVNFGSEGAFGMPSNIAFYVNSKQSDRADDIRIKVNINNSSTRKEAFQRLRSATANLLKAFNVTIPSQLDKALLAEKPTSLETSLGKFELIYESGRVDSYKVVITDKVFVAQEKASISTAKADFERCKSVISKAVGYAASSLKGDGKPLKENGYKSFMIEGQNKDIFFCEVHASGKYLIRAALGGEFPFKPIAEGGFGY